MRQAGVLAAPDCWLSTWSNGWSRTRPGEALADAVADRWPVRL